MITSRDLVPVSEDEVSPHVIPARPEVTEQAEQLTIRRRVKPDSSGGLSATVTLEAVSSASGLVARSESFRVTQPVTYASTASRTAQFRNELAAEGYEVIFG